MARRSALGKGLDALLPAPAAATGEGKDGEIERIPLDLLHPGPHQPRRRMRDEGLEELAQSIRAQGVIEPIVVRPRAAGGYEIVAGERRWRAAARAELEAVPAVVRQVDDRQAVALALIENIQREDLNPLEEGQALRSLRDAYALTHEQLADAVGKSRAAVTNLLRLLNLAAGAQELLAAGELEMGHARALLVLPLADQASVASRVATQRLSVRQTEALVRRLLAGSPAPVAADADTRRLERTLSERLGAPATIAAGKGGRGRIVIRYGSLEELDGLLSRLGVDASR